MENMNEYYITLVRIVEAENPSDAYEKFIYELENKLYDKGNVDIDKL